MNTKEIVENADQLPKNQKMAILDIIDKKISSDMKEVIAEIRGMQNSLNAKYNVLLGMISFLTIVVTVVTIMTKLK